MTSQQNYFVEFLGCIKNQNLLFCFSQSYDSSSICSELDRLQEHIEAERRDMLERLLEMRESFEREAVELRQMLDHDKARLRQQLRSVI